MKSQYSEDRYLPIFVVAKEDAPEYYKGKVYQLLGATDGQILIGEAPLANPCSWHSTKFFRVKD